MMRTRWLLATALAMLAVPVAADEPLVISEAVTAGIDGRHWDRGLPDANTFDAVHRAVLLRFPGAAEAIAAKLAEGKAVDRAEVVLTYAAHETRPRGYTFRGSDRIEKDPPRWHAVAWPLRRTWTSAEGLAPTFNAHLAGAGYWSKYGAADPDDDRFPRRLGPAELSVESPEARLDVTEVLTERAFGATPAERLRRFADRGLLLKKWELYDMRYDEWWSAYEWKVPTGGQGLTFRDPRLAVTFRDGGQKVGKLPPPADPAAVARELKAENAGGEPTAVWPTDAEIARLARRIRPKKPASMPAWRWKRVMELRAIGGGVRWLEDLESGEPDRYHKMMGALLATPPRYWKGWGIQDDLLLWYVYGDCLPAPVKDHLRLYWRAWLMPDMPTERFFHPQARENAAYFKKTGDWRGRKSFFRAGYNYNTSTMNFNHTAAMGALLGGAIIGSERAIADGRHGLEHYPMRLWSFLDGTSQEMLDHYYFSITLSGQKMFADFGPAFADRLAGRLILDRAMELLICGYHPRLHRILGASGRTNMPSVLAGQEGLYHVLHTLSPEGVLLHTDVGYREKYKGMEIFGHDFPPGRAAVQSRVSPWGRPWMSHAIDAKPLPFEVTATETTRGHLIPPLWRRTYLGEHYGLASQDIKSGTVDVIGQWCRTGKDAVRIEDLGTLTVRACLNSPNLTRTRGGTMPREGCMATFQHRNRAIVCSKPRTGKAETLKLAGKDGVRQFATVMALWTFQDEPTWKLAIDGEPVTELPARARFGQTILLDDGAAYAAIHLLEATDLGRRDEVVIARGEPGPVEAGSEIAPALTITSYNLQRDEPLDPNAPLWDRLCTRAYGGFAIELGDREEHGSFDAFARHALATRPSSRWEDANGTLHVRWSAGEDEMAMGFRPSYRQATAHFPIPPGENVKALPYRRVNGRWPYLAEGLDRDTTLSQQGRGGRLEKLGAVLTTDPNRVAILQAEPVSGTFTGTSPLPEPASFRLSVPGGVTLEAGGKVGMFRAAVRAKEGRLWIDHAVLPGSGEGVDAETVRVTGLADRPAVVLNGAPAGKAAVARAGEGAWRIRLPSPAQDREPK